MEDGASCTINVSLWPIYWPSTYITTENVWYLLNYTAAIDQIWSVNMSSYSEPLFFTQKNIESNLVFSQLC